MTEFRVGDDVFGVEGGANAEYVTVRERGVIAPKPTVLDVRGGDGDPRRRAARVTMLRQVEPLRGKRVLVYVLRIAHRGHLGLEVVRKVLDPGGSDRARGAVEANRYVETGQKTGNVVLRITRSATGPLSEGVAKHEEQARA